LTSSTPISGPLTAHVAFELQHPVDPKAVHTGLLDDDNREEASAGPRLGFATKLGDRRSNPDRTEWSDIFSPPPGRDQLPGLRSIGMSLTGYR